MSCSGPTDDVAVAKCTQTLVAPLGTVVKATTTPTLPSPHGVLVTPAVLLDDQTREILGTRPCPPEFVRC